MKQGGRLRANQHRLRRHCLGLYGHHLLGTTPDNQNRCTEDQKNRDGGANHNAKKIRTLGQVFVHGRGGYRHGFIGCVRSRVRVSQDLSSRSGVLLRAWTESFPVRRRGCDG